MDARRTAGRIGAPAVDPVVARSGAQDGLSVKRNPSPPATRKAMMGFAALNPSYGYYGYRSAKPYLSASTTSNRARSASSSLATCITSSRWKNSSLRLSGSSGK
jgi:hypothetical protein